MSLQLIEATAARLGPIHEAIAVYDSRRPLNAAARQAQGLLGALSIAEAEAAELREIRSHADLIPRSKLNGELKWVREEFGDLGFGLAEVFKYLPVAEMNADQRAVVLRWCRLVQDTETHYGIDLVAAGVDVNMRKNHINNPEWAYQHYHPLDNIRQAIDGNDYARRGLRVIRNMDPAGKLNQENMGIAIQSFGYTERALRGFPALANNFLRGLAIQGRVM
jgi:hypothetical protein